MGDCIGTAINIDVTNLGNVRQASGLEQLLWLEVIKSTHGRSTSKDNSAWINVGGFDQIVQRLERAVHGHNNHPGIGTNGTNKTDLIRRYTPIGVLHQTGGCSGQCGDDQITKPFDFFEVEARCRSMLRRQGGAADNCKKFEDTVLDTAAGELYLKGKAIALRSRELRLLEVFFTAPVQVF